MVNYVSLAATAKRLITKNGRQITFVTSPPKNADRPWKVDETDFVPEEVPLMGVFAPPNMVRQFGLSALGEGTEVDDLFTFVQTIAIVYPEQEDIRRFSVVRDQGMDWNMVAFQLLRPADLPIVAYVGLRR